jgi:hypothetical protein
LERPLKYARGDCTDLKCGLRMPKGEQKNYIAPGGVLLLARYPKLNVILTSCFRCRYGAISRGFAPLLRTLDCELMPIRGTWDYSCTWFPIS